MKQTYLLSIFIIALMLSTTIQLNNERSINEIMKEVYKTENTGREKESDYGLSSDQENDSESENEENEDSMQAESSSSTESLSENQTPYLPLSNKILLQHWFTIKSYTFGNNAKFPELQVPNGSQKILYTPEFQRINPQYTKGGEIKSQFNFYFRLTKETLYYSFNKKETNLAGAINMKNIKEMKWIPNQNSPCIVLVDGDAQEYTICGADTKTMTAWFCHLLKQSGNQKENICDPKNYLGLIPGKVIIKTVTQPLIIIPMPSKYCNTNWNYDKKGTNWECLCKDGKEQSPIDLPPTKHAIEVDIKPLFEYDFVDPIMTEDYFPANVKSGEKNVIRFEDYALKIKHPNFGKIVTLDGAVYIAQEIVFHTPSEHTIDRNVYDMEMQVIHYGRSIGDTIKKVVLSFLFKAKPGSFNKFIDKLNFFDLPNPLEKFRELSQSLYLPHIFLDSDEPDLSIMNPFSFYTYQGSLTTPPCNEQTIHYVVSNPIELSNTALELFKEALRVPDRIDARGNVVTSNSLMENRRMTQPLNGRTVFHYDSTKYNCPDFRRKSLKGSNINGHYEKRTKESVEYVFINGDKPSGIPNTFVVSESEAKGTNIFK